MGRIRQVVEVGRIFAKYLSRKSLQLCTLQPRIRRQTRLEARLGQKSLAVPSPFHRNLRQQ